MNRYNGNYEADKNRVNRSLKLAANNLYNKVAQIGLLASLKRLFSRQQVSTLYTLEEVRRLMSLGRNACDEPA